LAEVGSTFSTLRPDQVYVHTDAVKPGIMNEKNPGNALDISSIIKTLNDQNQASLKTMSTIIGRGESGVNTASVESRIFSMNADELNNSIEDLLSGVLTLAVRLHGFEGTVEVAFRPAELRPDMELEPQKTMRQSRLLQDLSLGLITDDEYHLQMHGRLAPQGAPVLSGTGFMSTSTPAVDAPTPNSDSLGRSLTPSGSKSAKSNTVKKLSIVGE